MANLREEVVVQLLYLVKWQVITLDRIKSVAYRDEVEKRLGV